MHACTHMFNITDMILCRAKGAAGTREDDISMSGGEGQRSICILLYLVMLSSLISFKGIFHWGQLQSRK